MATSGTIEASDNSIWPKHIIKCYIDIMVEEVIKGNMSNGVFSPKVWKCTLEKLNDKSGRSFTLKQIKQKFNRLRAKHREFSLLIQHTGFGWDAESNTVTAEEEVWRNYVLVHPEAVQYKKQGLEHYNLLGIIFNRSTATGILHHSSTQDPPNSQDENELENEYISGGVHVSVHKNNDDDDDDDDNVPETIERVTRSGKRVVELHDRKKKEEGKSNQLGEAIKALTEVSKARAEVQLAKAERLRVKSMEASSTGATSSDCSIARCVSVLDEIEGVSDDIYVKAMDKFTDGNWRELFMAVPLDRKKAWLNRLI